MSASLGYGDDGTDGFVAFVVEGDDGRGEFRCAECGYGAVVSGPLPACPMCRGTVWEASPWNAFAAAAGPRAPH